MSGTKVAGWTLESSPPRYLLIIPWRSFLIDSFGHRETLGYQPPSRPSDQEFLNFRLEDYYGGSSGDFCNRRRGLPVRLIKSRVQFDRATIRGRGNQRVS